MKKIFFHSSVNCPGKISMLPLTLIMHAAISYFFSQVVYAPINVKSVEGGAGGVRARGGDLTNFKIF